MSSSHRILQPAAWKPPRGYVNGIAARGTQVVVAGMIGWDASGRMVSPELAPQVQQALRNVLAVLQEAGAGPEHMTRMTWYVTDLDAYRAFGKEIGVAYRLVMGKHYAPMSVVQVVALVEADALVEIEVTATVPDRTP